MFPVSNLVLWLLVTLGFGLSQERGYILLSAYHSKITHREAPDKLQTQSYRIPDFIQCQTSLCFWNLKNTVRLINNAQLWRQFNPCSFVQASQNFARDLLQQTHETFYTVRVRSDTGRSGEWSVREDQESDPYGRIRRVIRMGGSC